MSSMAVLPRNFMDTEIWVLCNCHASWSLLFQPFKTKRSFLTQRPYQNRLQAGFGPPVIVCEPCYMLLHCLPYLWLHWCQTFLFACVLVYYLSPPTRMIAYWEEELEIVLLTAVFLSPRAKPVTEWLLKQCICPMWSMRDWFQDSLQIPKSMD